MTAIQIFRQYLCSFMISIGALFFCSIHTRQWLMLRGLLIGCACFLLIPLSMQLFGAFVAPQYPLTILAVTLVLRLAYRQRGVSLLIGTLVCMAVLMLADIITGLSFMAILGNEKTDFVASNQSPLVYLMNAVCMALIILLSLAYDRLRRFASKMEWRDAGRILRLVVLPATTIAIWVSIAGKAGYEDRAEYFVEILPVTVLSLISLIVSITYVIQDIRYVRQRRMNRALLEQKAIQDAMLQDTRVFRHNIANLLYGFRGTVMSGDAAGIREYYERMTATCRIINNENVVALQRIPSVPLHTLLMEKIQAANGRGIPFYVYTDADLIWRGLRDSEMCEALGVLLDNALEAAGESAAPLVTVELHNAGPDMETAVRNTCRDVERALAQPGKAGHEGLGLMSLKKLLDKHPNAVFNLYTRGRFVEAQLLLRGMN